ncbi:MULTISPECIES: Dna2/Cas4 domain-containing protein [Sphingobacterium]|uniref:Dna2/Cas4 domain-containing protein n=1 Tax=Sphingobacterium TaxID=28453 RepID=UPI0035E4090E
MKIDFYNAKNKIVHEVKKSDKVEHAHISQVKYYMYILARNGIEKLEAILGICKNYSYYELSY